MRAGFFLAGAITLAVAAGSCANAPSHPRMRGPGGGDFVSTVKKTTIGSRHYEVELGTLSLAENRRDSGSRRIDIPVRIFRSPNRGAAPVFYLAGGPGLSNLGFTPPEWLLQCRDVICVGYRGVDGSVRLDLPEMSGAFGELRYPLGLDGYQRLGRAMDRGLDRLRRSGIDIGSYGIIDVVDDIEAARQALGCGAIDLLSESYGTRCAYLYGVKYPGNVERSVMIGVNPPGCFVYEPSVVEAQLERYAELWRADPAARQKNPDILQTMRDALLSLPRDWFFLRIDPQKVKVMTFIFLFSRGGSTPNAAQVFDAYVAAGNGDYSGLAAMSLFYDLTIPTFSSWGDSCLKAVTADFDPERDYIADMDPPGALIGSPFAKLIWGAAQMMETPLCLVPGEYRVPRESAVPTLLISGSVDFSTPAVNGTQKLLPYLKNGTQVILSEFGHTRDLWWLQPDAFRRLVLSYLDTGTADNSLFHYQPMDFKPKTSLQSIATSIIGGSAAALAGGAAIALFFFLKG